MTTSSDSAYEAGAFVVKRLTGAGFRALFAGGCVRDRLLGRTPKDYDVATDASPDQVRTVFPRARLVGARFGVVLVRRTGYDIEVATFRRDGAYVDGRHPDEVTFGSEQDDARRRDFTINGLFLDPATGEIIDHVGGRKDIEAGVLRTIGDPEERFAEDYLRLLRAPRLAARLAFSIDPATRDAIGRLAASLRRITPERIWMELEEMLTQPWRQRGFRLLVELELHRHLSPEMILADERCEHIARVLDGCGDGVIDAALAVAALLTGGRRAYVRRVCRSFRLSNRVTDDAVWLVDSLDAAGRSGELELADFKMLMGHRAWAWLPVLLRAELGAKGAELRPYQSLMERAATIPPDGIHPPPFVSGDDLMGMGASPGPGLGEILTAVYRAQLNEIVRTPAEARALAESLLRPAAGNNERI